MAHSGAGLGADPLRDERLSRPVLGGLYRLGSVGLGTPMRDGMNLVAKEYVVLRTPKIRAHLILSKFAGAGPAASRGTHCDPNDKAEVSEAIRDALRISQANRVIRRRARWSLSGARCGTVVRPFLKLLQACSQSVFPVPKRVPEAGIEAYRVGVGRKSIRGAASGASADEILDSDGLRAEGGEAENSATEMEHRGRRTAGRRRASVTDNKEARLMRTLLKANDPDDSGTARSRTVLREGDGSEVAKLKPEAAYFVARGGVAAPYFFSTCETLRTSPLSPSHFSSGCTLKSVHSCHECGRS